MHSLCGNRAHQGQRTQDPGHGLGPCLVLTFNTQGAEAYIRVHHPTNRMCLGSQVPGPATSHTSHGPKEVSCSTACLLYSLLSKAIPAYPVLMKKKTPELTLTSHCPSETAHTWVCTHSLILSQGSPHMHSVMTTNAEIRHQGQARLVLNAE